MNKSAYESGRGPIFLGRLVLVVEDFVDATTEDYAHKIWYHNEIEI